MANIFTNLNLTADSNFFITQKINSIGYVGENTVTRLNIEVPEITDGATYELETENSTGEKNVALLSTDVENNTLYLDFTANMLTVNDLIMMQLRVTYADNSIKKSNRFAMKIAKSISATDYYEEYAVTIFDQLVNECRDIIEGAESYAIRAETAAVNAEAYEQSASASAEAASASEATATSASVTAVNAAASAETSANTAITSAETATTAANSASASASTAQTSAQTATSASVTAQSASEVAQTASTTATTAAMNAETAANTATTAANNASASATAAATSATAASNSATSATAAASNAATSETNAATSATAASTSAANANTSATNAANSASAAATSATNAHNSEVNASTSEANASTSATEAAASAESIATSVAQINENTYRINDLEAIIAGYQLTDLPTGAVASITDGTALLMPSLKVGIEPVQDLHGYDHPWAGGCGKNKLPLTVDGIKSLNAEGTWKGNNYALSGITFTIQTDNDGNIIGINVNGTATDNASLYLATPYTANFDCILNGCPANGSGSTYQIAVTGVGTERGSGLNISNGQSGNLYLRIFINYAASNLVFKPMIRLATETDPTYEPYSNICPIEGWSEANVSVTGINIWDEEWEVGAYDDMTGKKVPNNSYVRSKNAIKVVPSTTYCATKPAGGLWIGFYDINYVYLSKINTAGGVFTTPNDAYYLRLHTYGSYGTTYNHDISINYPSTDAEYHAYNGQTYTIQFKDGDNPLTVYGGTLDVTSGELTVTDVHITSYSGETLPSTWISDRDVYAEGTTPTTGAEVVYKLANSVTYHLTPTQIRTLVGNNNIWADTGDIIEGKYFKSLT